MLAVIARPLERVAEDMVGGGDGGEAFRGGWIRAVAVWVVG